MSLSLSRLPQVISSPLTVGKPHRCADLKTLSLCHQGRPSRSHFPQWTLKLRLSLPFQLRLLEPSNEGGHPGASSPAASSWGEVTSPHFSRTICEVPRPTITSALPAQLQFSEVWLPAAAILGLEPAFLGSHLSWAYLPSLSLLLGPSATNSKYAIGRGTSQVMYLSCGPLSGPRVSMTIAGKLGAT